MDRNQFAETKGRFRDSPNSYQFLRSGNWGNPDYLQEKENKSQNRSGNTGILKASKRPGNEKSPDGIGGLHLCDSEIDMRSALAIN